MTTDFEFDLAQPRHRVSREQALESIRRFAQKATAPLSGAAYRKSKPAVSVDTIHRLFGSFRAACQEAGVATQEMKRRFTDNELLDAFTAICQDRHARGLSAVPAIGDFQRYRSRTGSGPSYDVFVRRFGSFSDFKKLYQRFHRNEFDRAELLRRAKANLRARRSPISAGIRAQVLKRDESRCVTCGRHVSELKRGEALHVDHRIPIAKDGTNDLNNLQTKCSSCNQGKGARFED